MQLLKDQDKVLKITLECFRELRRKALANKWRIIGLPLQS
jgi:hypothetical protein